MLAVPLLVLLNAFFVAAEFALVAVRRTRVDEMVNQRRVGAAAGASTRSRTSTTRSRPRNWASRWPAWRLGWVGEPSMARLIVPAVQLSARATARGSPRTPWPRSWPLR